MASLIKDFTIMTKIGVTSWFIPCSKIILFICILQNVSYTHKILFKKYFAVITFNLHFIHL